MGFIKWIRNTKTHMTNTLKPSPSPQLEPDPRAPIARLVKIRDVVTYIKEGTYSRCISHYEAKLFEDPVSAINYVQKDTRRVLEVCKCTPVVPDGSYSRIDVIYEIHHDGKEFLVYKK